MNTHDTRHAFSGMGILGILVVLAIILALYFAAAPGGKSYVEAVGESRQQALDFKAETDDRQTLTLAVQYQIENGELPSGPEDLGVEWMDTSKDEFGTLVRYDRRTEGNVTFLDVVSAGEDLEHETEDDEVLRSLRVPAVP
jgi:hypothetical protein